MRLTTMVVTAADFTPPDPENWSPFPLTEGMQGSLGPTPSLDALGDNRLFTFCPESQPDSINYVPEVYVVWSTPDSTMSCSLLGSVLFEIPQGGGIVGFYDNPYMND